MSLLITPRSALFHTGAYCAFVDNYRVAARAAVDASITDYCNFVSDLLPFATDERSLRIAADHIEQRGGCAPGPNGQRLATLDRDEKWSLVRSLRDQLREGTFTVGGLREARIPKRPGCKQSRTIYIQNVQDRIVARSIAQILAPLLEAWADELSFCRRFRGVGTAVAYARREVIDNGRHLVIAEDLRDAFNHVPQQQLHDVLRSHIEDDRIIELALKLCRRPQKRGVLQGSALSALMLNALLDRFLHERWRAAHPDVPLVRYMDDLLVLARPGEDVEQLYKDLNRLCETAGFRLKLGRDAAIRDLRRGPVEWLGYEAMIKGDAFMVRPNRLLESAAGSKSHYELFARLHDRADGWRRVQAVVDGVLGHAAPTFPHVPVARMCKALISDAEAAGCCDPRGAEAISRKWEELYRSWLKNSKRLDWILEHGRRTVLKEPPDVVSVPTDPDDCGFEYSYIARLDEY